MYIQHAGRGKGNTKFVEEEICYQLWPVTGYKMGTIAAVCLLWTAANPVFSPDMRNTSSAHILGFRREYDQMTLTAMRGVYVSLGWGYQLLPNKRQWGSWGGKRNEVLWISPMDPPDLLSILLCPSLWWRQPVWMTLTDILAFSLWLTWSMGGTSEYQRV